MIRKCKDWVVWLIVLCLAAWIVWSFPAKAQVETIYRDSFEQPEPVCVNQPATLITWQVAWSSRDGSPQAQYPNSVGFPVPIGAEKGRPSAIYWTPGPGETAQIYVETVQPNPGQGYPAPRLANAMTFAISKCAGWFDVPAACVIGIPQGNLNWSTSVDSDVVCRIEPGTRYFLNVRADECSATPNAVDGCDVQATHRGF